MNENVKDALKSLIEIAEAKDIKIDDKPITVSGLQELVRERSYELADLLGISELYLKD